ncbi:MAG: SelB C-terminal domain-containing protein, partial [Bacteroidales bacterium]|nr:SelB C-terminal domain-containing protein [Bacteroidales bacterium]
GLAGKHIAFVCGDRSSDTGAKLKGEIERLTVERHYAGLDNALLSRCPSLRHSDLALCHLHLMGVGEGEIAALRSRTYSGIKKQNESLQEKLGVKESVTELVLRVAEGLVGSPDGVLSEVAWDETQHHSQKNSQKIVDLIKERPEITTAEMAERIGVSRRSIVNITNRLQEEGIIRRVGPDKGGHWEVIR